MRDLPRIVAETAANQSVELDLWRDGRAVKQSVTIARQDKRAQEIAQGGSSDTAAPSDTVSSDTLGATLAALTDEPRQHYRIAEEVKGVVVTGVKPGGNAAEQGLREGDVIVSVNQQMVATPADFEKIAKSAKDQKKNALLLLVNRGGNQLFVGIDVGQA